MRRGFGLVLIAAGVLALASGCASFGPRKHPEFKARQPNIRTVALLPTGVMIEKISFNGPPEILHDLIPPTGKALTEATVSTFKEIGYAVSSIGITPERLNADRELARSLNSVSDALKERIGRDQKKLFKGKFNYSVGADVNILADYLEADTLVYVNCQAVKRTKGEILKNLLIDAFAGVHTPLSQTVLTLVVLDGDTGDLLWAHSNVNAGSLLKIDVSDEKEVRKQMKGLVKSFPKSAKLKTEEKARKNKKNRNSGEAAAPPAQAPAPISAPAVAPAPALGP